MKHECIILCRDCNAPKNYAMECTNPECGVKKKVKWNPPNTRRKGLR